MATEEQIDTAINQIGSLNTNIERMLSAQERVLDHIDVLYGQTRDHEGRLWGIEANCENRPPQSCRDVLLPPNSAKDNGNGGGVQIKISTKALKWLIPFIVAAAGLGGGLYGGLT